MTPHGIVWLSLCVCVTLSRSADWWHLPATAFNTRVALPPRHATVTCMILHACISKTTVGTKLHRSMHRPLQTRTYGARMMHATDRARMSEYACFVFAFDWLQLASTCSGMHDTQYKTMHASFALLGSTGRSVSPLRAASSSHAAPSLAPRRHTVRRYIQFEDRFLRVTFANEQLGSCGHTDLSHAVCHRIRGLLLDGLTVGNRRFVFLGFSNSQLREHSCWLYCEDDVARDGAPSADAIRQSVGDLSALRVPSKYAARLGQGFSTTFETFRFQPHEICEIPDVLSPDGELFSDGVGVITHPGMMKVLSRLPSRMRGKQFRDDPCAVQIRLGGSKGVLAVWNDVPCDATSSLTSAPALRQSHAGWHMHAAVGADECWFTSPIKS